MIAVVQKRRSGPRLVPEVFGIAGRWSCICGVFCVRASAFGPSSCSCKYWVSFSYKDGTELGAGEVFRETITVLTWAC